MDTTEHLTYREAKRLKDAAEKIRQFRASGEYRDRWPTGGSKDMRPSV